MDSNTDNARSVNFITDTKGRLDCLNKELESCKSARLASTNQRRASWIMNPVLTVIREMFHCENNLLVTNEDMMSYYLPDGRINIFNKYAMVDFHINVYLADNYFRHLNADHKFLNDIDNRDENISVSKLTVEFMNKTNPIYSPTNIPLKIIENPYVMLKFPDFTENHWISRCLRDNYRLTRGVMKK